MDKKILVEKVRGVIASFKNEGKDFSFVGLKPVYPWPDTSYILVVSASFLDKFTNNQGISIMTDRLFDILDKKTLRYINRVEVHDKPDFDQWTVTRDFPIMNYQLPDESLFDEEDPSIIGRNMSIVQYQI